MTIKTLYTRELPVLAYVAENYLPGDVLITKISAATNDDGSITEYVQYDGETYHVYTFLWWQMTENGSNGASGFEFFAVGFYATNLKQAIKKFYRYLRLIALGETHEVAMEICEPHIYESFAIANQMKRDFDKPACPLPVDAFKKAEPKLYRPMTSELPFLFRLKEGLSGY